MRLILVCLLALMLAVFGCVSSQGTIPTRESKIPVNASKMTPESDPNPPIMHSDQWETPVSVDAPINTAGAEDSPFITPDGKTLYFFFTPDVRIPAERQITDGVTGIYASHLEKEGWSEPGRVVLQDPGKISGDGCEFVQDNTIWFCSVREGYTGVHWFTAEFRDGRWQGWKNADFDPDFEVGELHFSANGSELYFGSPRSGGSGGMDIWLSENQGGKWQEPENVGAVNSAADEGWPFISEDGKELWFLRTYRGSPAIFRSIRENGGWSDPELIISQFAGEPSLDRDGNIYFVHHFYNDSRMIEADIYVSYRK